MKKFILLIIAILIVIGLFLKKGNVDFEFSLTTTEKIKKDKIIDQKLLGLTLEEKVGQMLLFAYWGENSNEELEKAVSGGKVGSVMFLKSNIGTDEDVKILIERLQNSVKEGKPKIFIAADQEGGIVARLAETKEQGKSQYEISSPEEAYIVAKKRGDRLKSLGINLNFAPVLEYITDKNSFLYWRVFRGDKEKITTLGGSMVKGYKDAGIISTIKHFPGHENGSVNSHSLLPVVNADEKGLEEVISPFKEVLRTSDVGMVMMSHTLYPNFDKKYPSSISPYFVTNLLREGLDYDGVVITDDMNMGAITTKFGLEEAGIQAINAGNDILLYVVEPDVLNTVYNAILRAINNGEISENRINESVRRIIKLKLENDLW